MSAPSSVLRRVSGVIFLAAALCVVAGTNTPGYSSSIAITRFDDPPPDVCTTDDCSLREAIIAANTTAGPDTISLVRGTYSVSIHGRYEDASLEGDLDVTDDVTIAGSGPEETVVLMNSPPLEDRVFDVMPHVSLQLVGLAVRDVFFNLAPLDCGGGIRNRGDLTLTDVVIADNVMRGDGGGICNEGQLSITDSVISGNCACFAGYGGGLYSTGVAEVLNTEITGNQAHLLNGGGVHGSNIVIRNSAITDNAVNPGFGGGGVSIDNNGTIINTTISGNRSTIQFDILGLGLGGGVLVSGNVTLNNVTIADNSADGDGGGIYSCHGQPCRGEVPALVALSNTIVANNSADECSGPVTLPGHNLSSDGTCSLSAPGDVPNTNLVLGPLADNRGPTQTHALPPGSPAVDAGDNEACPEDQRGVSRPVDGNGDGVNVCDIGAYELHNCTADVNGDRLVDVEDLKIVALAMGSRQSTRRWNAAADLEPDGVIDVKDLRVVLRERGARDCG